MNEMNDVVTVIGFFMTLVGLLGSFFAIHLANWYRELQQLNAKWAKNSTGTSAERKSMRLDCLYAITGLSNGVVEQVTVAITVYLLLVAGLSGCILVPKLGADFVGWATAFVLGSFILIYVTFTVRYLRSGHALAKELQIKIEEQVEKDVNG